MLNIPSTHNIDIDARDVHRSVFRVNFIVLQARTGDMERHSTDQAELLRDFANCLQDDG